MITTNGNKELIDVNGDSQSVDRFVSSFVGRQTELDQIQSLLTNHYARLVTLTGPSGVGKTRIALRAAERLSQKFNNHVWLVELGAVDDPTLVGASIARVIGAPPNAGGAMEDVIANFIGARPSLLILDSLEHLLEAAPFVGSLLAMSPNLHLLATSQTVLRLSGEHSVAIGPLPVPQSPNASLHGIESVDATMLFLERARAIQADFGQLESEANSIAEIVRRLDGIPLAIEIAASRANVLTPQSLLARLDEGLLDFAEVSRDRPRRQQTLRAAIAWSHGFLSEIEKLVFRRLSVFRAGFGLDAAEAVVGLPGYHTFLDALSLLVDRSLVRRLSLNEPAERFGILAAPREFATELLHEADEYTTIRNAHLAWFIDLAELSEETLLGPEQPEWLARIASDQGNFRAAMKWALDHGDVESSLRLSSALWRYWSTVGNLAEARGWLTQAIELKGEHHPHLKAKALHHLGNITLDMGDFAASRVSYEAGYALVAAGDDKVAIARAFNGLGLVNYFQGHLDAARQFHEQALALRLEAGDRIGISLSHSNLGDVALAMGNLDEARARHESALELRQALKNYNSTGYSTLNLGTVAWAGGSPQRAKLLLDEALRIMRSSNDQAGTAYVLTALGRVYRNLDLPETSADHLRQALEIRTTIGDLWGTVDCIDEIATLAATVDRWIPAIELFSATSKQREQMTAPLLPVDQQARDQLIVAITGILGAQRLQDHMYAGLLYSMTQATNEAMDLAGEIAAQQALKSTAAATGPAVAPVVSPRELEVLRLAAQGLTDQQIADALFMSRRTATTHQANIRQKLVVQNRAEAVAFASREGLI